MDEIKLKENETVELKKTTSELKEAMLSICAILNKHQKGKLYFGIKNDGIAIGQDISERTIREISETKTETTQKTTQKILDAMQKKPKITREELAKLLNLTPDGIKYNLSLLKKQRKLKRIGGRKEGYWEVWKK